MQDGEHVQQCMEWKRVYSISSGSGTLLAHSQIHSYLLDHIDRRQSYFTSISEISKSRTVHVPESAYDAAIQE